MPVLSIESIKRISTIQDKGVKNLPEAADPQALQEALNTRKGLIVEVNYLTQTGQTIKTPPATLTDVRVTKGSNPVGTPPYNFVNLILSNARGEQLLRLIDGPITTIRDRSLLSVQGKLQSIDNLSGHV